MTFCYALTRGRIGIEETEWVLNSRTELSGGRAGFFAKNTAQLPGEEVKQQMLKIVNTLPAMPSGIEKHSIYKNCHIYAVRIKEAYFAIALDSDLTWEQFDNLKDNILTQQMDLATIVNTPQTGLVNPSREAARKLETSMEDMEDGPVGAEDVEPSSIVFRDTGEINPFWALLCGSSCF